MIIYSSFAHVNVVYITEVFTNFNYVNSGNILFSLTKAHTVDYPSLHELALTLCIGVAHIDKRNMLAFELRASQIATSVPFISFKI